jgi:hypothetical protein
VAAAIIVVLALQLAPSRPMAVLHERIMSARPAVLGVGLAVTIMLVAAAVPGGAVPPFIYFAF